MTVLRYLSASVFLLTACGGAATDQNVAAPASSQLREGAPLNSQPDAQSAFRKRIESAFAADDREAAIKELFYLENTDEETQGIYTRTSIPMLARDDLETIAFEPLPDDFQGDYAMKGYRYEPDPAPIGYVALNDKTRAPYGEVGGAYYFTGMTRTLVNADAPPEQTIQALVIAMAAEPIDFEGECDVLRSDGKVSTHSIENFGNGSATLAVNAVRFESCRVRKLSDEGSLSLRIIESDETLFEQSVTDNGAEIVYSVD